MYTFKLLFEFTFDVYMNAFTLAFYFTLTQLLHSLPQSLSHVALLSFLFTLFTVFRLPYIVPLTAFYCELYGVMKPRDVGPTVVQR